MVRVVLDTNILVSGLISSKGAPHAVLGAWRRRTFTLISHPWQIEELRDVSRRDKIRSRVMRHDFGRLINQITEVAQMVGRLSQVSRSPDPNDDFLLALCDAGAADRLVTGDKADLLALENHGTATILTAAAFAAELGLYSR